MKILKKIRQFFCIHSWVLNYQFTLKDSIARTYANKSPYSCLKCGKNLQIERRDTIPTPKAEVVRVYHDKVNGTVKRTADAYYVGVKCSWYHPCPICQRCMASFPSKYERCKECSVTGCYHTTKQRNMLIKRKGSN